VAKAEPTETGLLVNVGDFMHANGQSNTTYSGTPLDVDTRQHKTMREAGMVMRYMIDRMLTKFKKVVVVVARGNHDTDPAPAVQLMLEFYYSREPRVNVLDTEGFYHYIEYGNWLLGVTHGDKQKPEALAGSMARDMPQAWGRTTHRMWCCGHFHKEQVKTLPGVKYKIFAALPPPDSWHAAHGFKGDGEMEMLTFRKEGGLYSSFVYNIPQPQLEPDVSI
jgi:predicted phosphodiesterase